jgi:hypothetical protein
MITPSVPGAPGTSWTTPERPGTMPVSATVATHESVPGGQPIAFPGGPDAGGRDDVAASVAGAVAAAEARFGELQGDTYGQGSQIGDMLSLPDGPAGHSKHTGPPPDGYPG